MPTFLYDNNNVYISVNQQLKGGPKHIKHVSMPVSIYSTDKPDLLPVGIARSASDVGTFKQQKHSSSHSLHRQREISPEVLIAVNLYITHTHLVISYLPLATVLLC